MTKKKPKFLLLQTYLAMIQNAPGTAMFKHLFVEIDGTPRDVLNDGQLSCASFVTSVLKLYDLIDDTHATVARTVDELPKAGWEQIVKPRPGAVVVWVPREYEDGRMHGHVGFAVSDVEAVSTSTKRREVVRHPFNELDGAREVESFWWHPRLDA